jgi:hypothetical protein
MERVKRPHWFAVLVWLLIAALAIFAVVKLDLVRALAEIV